MYCLGGQQHVLQELPSSLAQSQTAAEVSAAPAEAPDLSGSFAAEAEASVASSSIPQPAEEPAAAKLPFAAWVSGPRRSSRQAGLKPEFSPLTKFL